MINIESWVSHWLVFGPFEYYVGWNTQFSWDMMTVLSEEYRGCAICGGPRKECEGCVGGSSR